MRLKKDYFIYIVLVILITLTGFNVYGVWWNNTPPNVAKPQTEKPKIKIGISLGTLKEERWVHDRDILEAKAKEAGAEVYVQNANNDDTDQLDQVKYLIDKGIKVLILVPNDMEKAAEIVQMAHKAGVKVISYDRLVLNAGVDLYLSFDNREIGRLMAKAILAAQPTGNYVILNGAANDNNSLQIKDGYDSVFSQSEKEGKIKILTEYFTPDWLAESAYKKIDNLLQANKNIQAVLAGDDSLAGAAIEALSEYRLAGKVEVVGQDADLAACRRLVQGTQLMTVYKPIDKLAALAIRMALKMANNQSLGVYDKVSDGKYLVPYQYITPIAVNRSNLDDTVLKDGYQNREDVYR
ncbi:ABC-type xylose transport system, periplasmic component [Desulfosporosinus acidiphilus SJ4]|uniref:ABC-type xylose transport system, periplasmic component n=2 Tax=Desulfosporosinus TaxID=79206 RepID=I4D2P6_DESAJ|nr:ABC-type xylose transport system, periplasmic component [Desulfosporosinus acidiphilus SJ4]